MYQQTEVIIVAAKRTALGHFQGQFSQTPAPELAAAVIQDILQVTQLEQSVIDEAIMGCVLPAGLGQAPARQAVLKAGLPHHVGATTVNKVCGSGMKSVMMAFDAIRAGSIRCVLAGGMENMSLAPYILPQVRSGFRAGHRQTLDHIFMDGLEDAYTGKLMGVFADATAKEMGITREVQDDFALSSLRKAQKAIESGFFKDEIVPVTLKYRGTSTTIDTDEAPQHAKPSKIPELKPAFDPEGTITAANASSLSDGASVLMLMSEQEANKHALPVLARIKGHATYATQPEAFTSAPIGAISKLLSQIDWSTQDVDLYEINEAFAMVTLLAIAQLELDPNKVNIAGGACALGHPIGSTGARILVTLLHSLKQKGLHKGVASLCIGGGEATAVALEVV